MNEDQLHKQLVGYLRFAGLSDRAFFHTPNEGKVSRGAAVKRQAMGVNAGVPDLIFTGPLAALELKVNKGTVSTEQREWLVSAAGHGWRVSVTNGMHASLLQLMAWGFLPVGGPKGGPLSPHMLALRAEDPCAWKLGKRPHAWLKKAANKVADGRASVEVFATWSCVGPDRLAQLAPIQTWNRGADS